MELDMCTMFSGYKYMYYPQCVFSSPLLVCVLNKLIIILYFLINFLFVFIPTVKVHVTNNTVTMLVSIMLREWVKL